MRDGSTIGRLNGLEVLYETKKSIHHWSESISRDLRLPTKDRLPTRQHLNSRRRYDIRCVHISEKPSILTDPDTGCLHRAHSAFHCGDAVSVGACSNFTEEAFEVVALQPVSGRLKTLGANGRRDTVWAGTGAVLVKVLVHF